MKKQDKTNVMRILDQRKVQYESHYYTETDAVSGIDVATVMGQNPDQVFKTLVTIGKTGQYYVFVVPVSRDLDLRKAAAAVGEKSIAMIKAKELLPLTGYIHGGCSPIGMKKAFPTVIDSRASLQPTIIFSGGKIGYQVELTLEELGKVLSFQLEDLSN